MSWEVQQWTVFGGWVNGWLLDDQPQIFDTYEQALAELEEYIAEREQAARDGDIDEAETMDDFRIEEIA